MQPNRVSGSFSAVFFISPHVCMSCFMSCVVCVLPGWGGQVNRHFGFAPPGCGDIVARRRLLVKGGGVGYAYTSF